MTLLLIGVPLIELKSYELYILKEHNQYYGFDLGEIWEWVCKHEHGTNPYTTNIIPQKTIRQIKRLYDKLLLFKRTNVIAQINTNINTEENTATSTNTDASIQNLQTINYSAKLTGFFLRIESMGCYANIEGYKDLNNAQLTSFFKSLYNDYESIRSIITPKQYQSVINPTESDIKYHILTVLECILNCPRSEQEDRALIFTLHLSKCLSPNNDELEHYYLSNINYLIQHIIQHNTYSETFEGIYDDYDDDDIDDILNDLNGIQIDDNDNDDD